MCTNIGVTLPTVTSFLLLYSLRCGCIVILIWTAMRAMFFLSFFIVSMIEVYLTRPPLMGFIFPIRPEAPVDDDDYFLVFMAFLVMIVSECILGMYIIYMGIGLYYDTPGRIEQYLVCRFISWISETLVVVVLCLEHHSLIGWYLAFLMIIILEFYGFIVVYSYYIDMVEEGKANAYPISSTELRKRKSDLCPC